MWCWNWKIITLFWFSCDISLRFLIINFLIFLIHRFSLAWFGTSRLSSSSFSSPTWPVVRISILLNDKIVSLFHTNHLGRMAPDIPQESRTLQRTHVSQRHSPRNPGRVKEGVQVMNYCWIRPLSGDSCSFVLPKRNGSCPLTSGWPPSPRTPAVSSTSQPAVEERAGGRSMARELRHYFCTDLGLFFFKPPSTTTSCGVAGLKRQY